MNRLEFACPKGFLQREGCCGGSQFIWAQVEVMLAWAELRPAWEDKAVFGQGNARDPRIASLSLFRDSGFQGDVNLSLFPSTHWLGQNHFPITSHSNPKSEVPSRFWGGHWGSPVGSLHCISILLHRMGMSHSSHSLEEKSWVLHMQA